MPTSKNETGAKDAGASGVPRSSMQVVSNPNLPEMLSEIYKRQNGRVPPKVVIEYARVMTRITDLNNPDQNQFFNDYLATIARIEQDKIRLKEGIREIDRNLLELPTSLATTVKLNELVIQPEMFDGEKPRPRRWIHDYNEAIVANGWSDHLAIKYLPTYLTKAAKDWYFVDVKPNLTTTTKWYHVYEVFIDNFLSEADEEQLTRAIENSKQRPGENVSTFLPRMRRLLQLLNPNISEKEQLAQVIRRLRQEYKPWVSHARPKSLKELRETCQSVESGRVGTSNERNRTGDGERPRARPGSRYAQPGPRRGVRQNLPRQYPPRNGNIPNYSRQTNSKKEYTQGNGPRYNSDKVEPSKSTCYECGKTGHFAKDCWSKKNRSKENPRRNNFKKSVNLVQHAAEQPTEVLTVKHLDGPTKPKYAVCEIKSDNINLVVGGGKLLRQTLICNSVEINAVVDTGAYVTVIDESIADHFKWKIDGSAFPLVGANGQPLDSKGSVNLKIELCIKNVSRIIEQRVAVVKDLTAPMLLGLELMQKLRINIETAEGKLRFAKNGIGSGLRTCRDEVVPARSQIVMEGKVNMVGTVLTVPFLMNNGLAIANTIARAEGNKLPIVILNPFQKEIIIRKDTQVASVEPLDDKDEPTTEGHCINQVMQVEKLNEPIKVGDTLTKIQKSQLEVVLNSNASAFSIKGEIGKTDVIKHTIEIIPGSEPVVEPLRRRAQVQIDETRRQVNELLKEGIIEESDSPWASAYVLAKKKNGEYRLCIDFRKLNLATKKVVYPLPNIDECLETLSGKRYFSQLDFKSGFWQIAMDEKSKELTSFRTEDGQYQFKRMPFGLTNAPATFQKMVNTILAGLKGMNLQVFIDDICIATKTWEEHLIMLDKVLKVVIKAKLKIKADKCVFGSNSVKFLGHEISEHGIKQDPDKLKALAKLPPPVDTKGVKRALGMFSYYRKFVNNFALLSEPLTRLTRKGVAFVWEDEQKQAYESIIQELNKNATLAHFNHEDPLLLKTDASKSGVAGMLLQKQDGEWRIITCCSRRLSTSEGNYGITDLEGLAVVYTLSKLRPYLLGKKFRILVDHCALCVLNKRSPNSARLRRWAIVLSEYDFEIVYTKGKLHCDIDCLSRAPVDDPTDAFLEDKVYMIRPFDKHTWTYMDNESREIFQKAFDKEDDLRIVDDLVYKGESLYVPQTKRFDIIHGVHNSNLNAHPGVSATVSKLKENYWWPNMNQAVDEVIKKCMTCLTQKPNREKPAGLMRSFEIYQPGEQIAIDLIEKITESVNGNSYIIVAIDMFTRFVDAKAVPDKGAPTFTQFLIEYCGRYGVPQTILTDQSTTFCNEFTSQVLKVFGASHVKSTPYHSQGNAVVERVNQTLEEKIRLVLDDPLHERNWDSVLPVAVLAINTSIHSSLGCSPYEMTFGRRAPLQDKNIVYKATPTDLFAKNIQHHMKECYRSAIAIQSASKERARKYYDSKRREDLFEIGDTVLTKAPSRSSKLSPKFIGPFKVIGKKNDIYTLEDLTSNRKTTRHVADLRHVPGAEQNENQEQ